MDYHRIYVFDKDCVPVIGTEHSAGFDIKADIKSIANDNILKIKPGEVKQIPTGIQIQTNFEDFHVFVACKSGLAVNHGLWVGEHSHRERLWINVINSGQKGDVLIKHGQPIAQVIVACDKGVKKFHPLSLSAPICIKSNERVLVPVSLDFPHFQTKECGIISTLEIHDQLSLFPGVIDSDFCGQLKIFCMNESKISKHFEKGVPIAVLLQLDIVNHLEQFNIIDCFSDTPSSSHQFQIVRKERGIGGFGSTQHVDATFKPSNNNHISTYETTEKKE